MSAKAPAKGHTAKHTHKQAKHHKAKGKHHPQHHPKPATGTGHNVHTAGKPAAPAKPRGLAIGDLLPVCAAEALAISLRLAGRRVSDDEVEELHWLAGGCEDQAVSIEDALAAAARFGLAGWRVVQQGHVGPVDTEALCGKVRVACGELGVDPREGLVKTASQLSGESFCHALILGVDVPGPHCVLATPDGWWSWGELHAPWPCRVEEAWVVAWQ